MKKMIKKILENRTYTFFLLTIYLIGLGYFLFLSERLGRREPLSDYRYNLVPFKEIMRYIKRFEVIGFLRVFLNLAGNVLAFIPLGVFLPSLMKQKKFRFFRTFSIGFFFTCLVESIQILTKVGCYDVDDIFLNSVGVLIGYLFFIYFQSSNE